MNAREAEVRWERLLALLAPIHAQAAVTARRLCRHSADGDDLYQEAVLRAFEKLHTLRDASRFRSWFYAVLLSRHRTRCRPSFWRRFLPLEEAIAQGKEPVGEDATERAEESWRAERARRALASLAAEQREAVVLFEIDGHSIEEIATMQQVSISAVKSRLVRGRERLRRFYVWQGWEPVAASAQPAASPVASSSTRKATSPDGEGFVRLAAAAPGLAMEERSHE